MHFSIPDTHEFKCDNGSYTGFNIHINGLFHCTVRYKQLLSLHEQLRHQFPSEMLPQFPPKKFLPLTNLQLEERRVLLERYMQLIGQSLVFSNTDLVTGFLAASQQETHSAPCQEVLIEVHIMSNYKIPLTVLSTESSDQILEKVCRQLLLTRELMKYFSLFLIDWDCAKSGMPSLKRLEGFESPYISQKYVRPSDTIVLRKSYWDPCYDVDLMIDNVALDLLYIQTIAEIDLGWITTTSTVRDRLRQYQEKGQKREYMEFIRSLKHYGRIPAGDAIAEGVDLLTPSATQIPKSAITISSSMSKSCRVKMALIARDLILTIVGAQARELRFRVTRMRGWRITTLHGNDDNWVNQNGHYDSKSSGSSSSVSPDSGPQFELSFEYLVTKDHLEWITLKSVHVTYVSVCLQSIVHELMRQKCGSGFETATRRRNNQNSRLIYVRRDGSSFVYTPMINSPNGESSNEELPHAVQSKETFSIRRLSEKFASVAFKTGKDCVENDAFEGIGDDDL